MENARLFVSCDNVATITGYSGFDPEVDINGIDNNRYPISRTLSLGVKSASCTPDNSRYTLLTARILTLSSASIEGYFLLRISQTSPPQPLQL